jgi:hypothetical protein
MQEAGPGTSERTLEKIVTHDDFDGVVSAALCSLAEKIDSFRFSTPGSILDSRLGIGPDTIVCDLPHHPDAGLWFDHHVGNLEDYRLKGGDPEALQGAFSPEKSCARVVHDHFAGTGRFPDFLQATVREADIIDSFDYRDIEDWQRETPGKLIADSIKAAFPSLRDRDRYLRHLIRQVRALPLEEIVSDPEVRERLAVCRIEAEKSRALIEKLAAFLPGDSGGEIILLDTTGLKHGPVLNKSLALLSHPEAPAVLEVKCLFRQKRKTNDLGFSMSLSPCVDEASSTKDIGEIMRSLNMGDGHRGAGAGRVSCRSKPEMLKRKDEILGKIFQMWRRQ